MRQEEYCSDLVTPLVTTEEDATRALTRSNAHFASPKGADLFDRLAGYASWIEARRRAGVWPYSRTLLASPRAEAAMAGSDGVARSRINLAVQDYLGLATHPQICDAALRAVRDFGVHSAGSAMLVGNNSLSRRLETSLRELLQLEEVLLFPTGWAAGFGVVTGLVRDCDHIVLDSLAHACLQAGSSAATKNLHRYRHLDVEHAGDLLRGIRGGDSKNAILVIAEGLYSMDSDSPDLARLQALCREYGAKLLVDVAHDLGALGPDGGGTLAAQGVLGHIDLVMGAFSKTFASNGGFVATSDTRVRRYLQWFASSHTFSNALSPVQCAVVDAAIATVRSSEGEGLRRRLQRNARHFRQALEARGLRVLGNPSAIVPVLIGQEGLARMASRWVEQTQTSTNLVEFPAVGLGAARFRCQLMASHELGQLSRAADDIADAVERATADRRQLG